MYDPPTIPKQRFDPTRFYLDRVARRHRDHIAAGQYSSARPDQDQAPCAKDRLPVQPAIERHLKQRLGDLFDLHYELLLYDITSTYFEGQCLGNPMAQRGYSRDSRPDCPQVCIGLVVTTDGIPLGYEVFDGNTSDSTTVGSDPRSNSSMFVIMSLSGSSSGSAPVAVWKYSSSHQSGNPSLSASTASAQATHDVNSIIYTDMNRVAMIYVYSKSCHEASPSDGIFTTTAVTVPVIFLLTVWYCAIGS